MQQHAKRVLIKLSGEAMGENGKLFDYAMIDEVASVVAGIAKEGVEVALVVGAGNIWRGRQGIAVDVNAVVADQMGMLATAINSLAMYDALTRAGARARVLSAIELKSVAEAYNTHNAIKYLTDGEVLIFACGTGNPFFSTDTAAALRAIEIGAGAILLAKNIDGVYDDDPKKNPDAKLIPDLTYQEALRRGLKVMDAAALTLCDENRLPEIQVFGLDKPARIREVLEGAKIGSVVHP